VARVVGEAAAGDGGLGRDAARAARTVDEVSPRVDLRLGDCLEVLPGLLPQSVDAIITDLPYGTTQCAWDSVIPLGPLWAAVNRMLAVSGVFVTTAAQPFTSALIMSNLDWFRYTWVWEKNTGTRFLDAQYRPLLFHEDIAVFSHGRHTYNPQKQRGQSNHSRRAQARPSTELYRAHTMLESDESGMKYPRTVLHFDTPPPSAKTDHPTEKPLDLYSYLVLTYTNPGDVVLDLAMGSGTTGVACVKLGRHFIGIEKDPAYFVIAQRRIAEAQAQPALFQVTP
jgi:site-specific DNA-methyltransferase (adenine-specific)